MAYPVLGEFQGIPPEYQSGAQWVSNSAYQGGGYYANETGEQLTYAQLERLWMDAGGSAQSAPYMAYIAKYDESGGYVGAWNSSGATGPWQVEWPSNYGGSRESLFTPLVNAQQAVKLFNASGYAPWGNDVKQNLGIPPASSVPGENTPVPGGSAASASTAAQPATLTSATGGFLGGALGSFLGLPNLDVTDIAERIGLVILGAALILLGIYMLTSKQVMRLAPLAGELLCL